MVNTNRAFHMPRMKLYVCPICENLILSAGEAVISCCGVTLPALEAEPADDEHPVCVECVEDEYYISIRHEMSRTHHVSFIAAVSDDGCQLQKLYPEGSADARCKIRGTKLICFYCNQHGLFKVSVPKNR